MYNTPAASQLLRPPGRQRDHHQGCLEMLQGFYTHSRIKEELAEEEDSHLDRQITQWRRQASPTTLWVPLGGHHQHLAQEALVC